MLRPRPLPRLSRRQPSFENLTLLDRGGHLRGQFLHPLRGAPAAFSESYITFRPSNRVTASLNACFKLNLSMRTCLSHWE